MRDRSARGVQLDHRGGAVPGRVVDGRLEARDGVSQLIVAGPHLERLAPGVERHDALVGDQRALKGGHPPAWWQRRADSQRGVEVGHPHAPLQQTRDMTRGITPDGTRE